MHCIVFTSMTILIVGLIVYSSASTHEHHHENRARYDHYRLYRLDLETEEHVRMLQELEHRSDSITFLGHARSPGQKLTIMVAAHSIGDITELFQRYKLKYEILNYNFQASIDEQFKNVKPKGTPASEYNWDNYYHLETTNEWLDQLSRDHPNTITLLSLGNSFNGLPIRGVKLSKKSGNTGVFVEGGIHAREWISPSTVTFILNELLHSNDTDVQDIALNFDWYIFPVVNPDGYKHSFEVDRMWRKTRQPFGQCLGADLNRNFDSSWNQTGSSPDPCRYDFAGSSVNSEPEAAAISAFIHENKVTARIRTYISLHSFSQLLMFPYGHSNVKPENYADLKSIGKKAITALAQRYGTEYLTGSIHEIIYPSSGGSTDWAYEKEGIPLTFTFELRGPPNSTNLFILPANEITPVGLETLDAFVALLQEARTIGYFN